MRAVSTAKRLWRQGVKIIRTFNSPRQQGRVVRQQAADHYGGQGQAGGIRARCAQVEMRAQNQRKGPLIGHGPGKAVVQVLRQQGLGRRFQRARRRCNRSRRPISF